MSGDKIIKLTGAEEAIQKPGIITQKVEIVVETDTVAKTQRMNFRTQFATLSETIGVMEMAKYSMLGGGKQ